MVFIERQTLDMRADYVNPFHTEAGGMLSLTMLSGIQYATYEPTPNENTVPLGMQQHSQEEVDLFRAIAPWNTHRSYSEFTCFPYMTLGVIVTNAVHPDIDPSTVLPGQPVYLAPSGLVTSATTWSSRRIGTFDSALNDATIGVPGGALGASQLRVAGNMAIVNPDPVYVSTAGWVRMRVNISR